MKNFKNYIPNLQKLNKNSLFTLSTKNNLKNDTSISKFPIPKDFNHMGEEFQEKIKTTKEKSGFIPNVFLALGYREKELQAFSDYHDTLMNKPLAENITLTKSEREMIVVAISSLNRCNYCSVAHGAILRIYEKNSLIADQISNNYKKCDLITQRQKDMLDFAVKVSFESHNINEDDYNKLYSHNFTEDDIWDIGSISAFFSMSNRLANLINLKPNQEFYLMGRIPKNKN